LALNKEDSMFNKIRLIFKYSNFMVKSMIVLSVVYVSIGFSLTSIGAISELTLSNSTSQPVTVTLKDGAKEEMSYLVNSGTVAEILDRLHIGLQENDIINLELDSLYLEGDVIEITRVTYVEEVRSEEIAYTTERNADTSVELFADDRIVQEGVSGVKEITYRITYQNDEVVAEEVVGETIVSEPINEVTGYGVVQVGSTFTGRLTSYGADCYGCSGRTAAGVDVTNGVNNSGKATYTLNGNEYYVLAADSSIPFGTIIKVSNHNYSISDPFYGIVLDRGGDINGSKVDLYYGLQNGAQFFSGGTSYSTTFEIVSIGSGGRY